MRFDEATYKAAEVYFADDPHAMTFLDRRESAKTRIKEYRALGMLKLDDAPLTGSDDDFMQTGEWSDEEILRMNIITAFRAAGIYGDKIDLILRSFEYGQLKIVSAFAEAKPWNKEKPLIDEAPAAKLDRNEARRRVANSRMKHGQTKSRADIVAEELVDDLVALGIIA